MLRSLVGLGDVYKRQALVLWISIQLFAWVLGVFSPNIHAARLHFVEWMKQFYDGSGEPFEPFGSKPKLVEVDQ